jgi:four helix bundle protein
MDKIQQSELFLKRLEKFSDDVNNLCKPFKFNNVTSELISQLVRAAGSPGANYIEAVESLSRKDFYFRIRICRKESREAGYWLRRLSSFSIENHDLINKLEDESRQLVLIFSKILASDTVDK